MMTQFTDPYVGHPGWPTYGSMNWVIIGLVPKGRQAITWTNADSLSIGSLESTSVNFESKDSNFYSQKYIWKCFLQMSTIFLSLNMFINSTDIWVNIGSDNGLLPDGTKPLHEPVLTYH